MNNQLPKETTTKTIQKTQTFSITKVFLTVVSITAVSSAIFAGIFYFNPVSFQEPANEVTPKDRLIIENEPWRFLSNNPNSPISTADIDRNYTGQEFAFCGEDGLLHVYRIEPYNYGDYPVSGFPQPGCPSGAIGSAKPAVGDIDNDGEMEIVVGSYSSGLRQLQLYAYNHDGTLMNSNWPVHPSPYLDSYKSITLANTNSDDYLEIIVVGDSYDNPGTFIFDLNGNKLAELEYGNMTEVGVADLDKDGNVEIVVGETHRNDTDDNYYTNVSVYDGNGNEKAGQWPLTINGTIQTNFAIANIDKSTSELEIVAASSGMDYENAYSFSNIYVWDYQGNNATANWPKRITSQEPYGPSYAGVSIGDIVTIEGEETDHLEIVASVGKDLYVLDDTGEPINANWPVNLDTYVINPALIGDFNGDNQTDIQVSGFSFDDTGDTGKLFILNNNGQNLLDPTGKQLYLHQVQGITFGSAAADFDNDGKTEVIFSVYADTATHSGEEGIYRLDLSSPYNVANMYWSQYEHDGRNTGNYESQCSDKTYIGECSTTKPQYCQNGELIKKCSVCGCTAGNECKTDGSCAKKSKKPVQEIPNP